MYTSLTHTRVFLYSYLIDPKKDHIGVFISIVSTKIPYKGNHIYRCIYIHTTTPAHLIGTSKEYIGADITEIHKAVKTAIQGCCLQLKTQLSISLKAKNDYERKRLLTKYGMDDVFVCV